MFGFESFLFQNNICIKFLVHRMSRRIYVNCVGKDSEIHLVNMFEHMMKFEPKSVIIVTKHSKRKKV